MKKVFTISIIFMLSVMTACSQNSSTMSNKLLITVGNTTLTATLVDNTSTQALCELLADGSITIDMSDYGDFEKVGSLPQSLPRNDERITTEAGDLILYQGRSFVIYYDTNTWSFTRLGKIDNITQQQLKNILGDGDVTVTLSLQETSGIKGISGNSNKDVSAVYNLSGVKMNKDNATKGIYIVNGKKIVR